MSSRVQRVLHHPAVWLLVAFIGLSIIVVGGTFAFGYALLWAALRPGGLLISDDIHDNLAFRVFTERISRKPWVVAGRAGSYIGVLRK